MYAHKFCTCYFYTTKNLFSLFICVAYNTSTVPVVYPTLPLLPMFGYNTSSVAQVLAPTLRLLYCPSVGNNSSLLHRCWQQQFSTAQVLATTVLYCTGVGNNSSLLPKCWQQQFSTAQVLATTVLYCPSVGNNSSLLHRC